MDKTVKQRYMAPQIEVIEMEVQTTLMALSADNSLDGTTSGGSGSGFGTGGNPEIDANGRRGTWGNLWEER